ncbi:hypothetical protein HZA38_05005 [Candidatus Peregrinibacteria bacterium]|nr:hypothetical protein [Candidatus Peregrinibacteria bacterium]
MTKNEFQRLILLLEALEIHTKSLQKSFDSFRVEVDEKFEGQARSLEKKLDEKFAKHSQSLEEKLDEKFAKHSQSLEEKLDEKFAKHSQSLEKKLDEKMDTFQMEMVFLIEHEVVTRLDGISDSVKMYTDRKVQQHEEKYHIVV